jgi:hypothetical protein
MKHKRWEASRALRKSKRLMSDGNAEGAGHLKVARSPTARGPAQRRDVQKARKAATSAA